MLDLLNEISRQVNELAEKVNGWKNNYPPHIETLAEAQIADLRERNQKLVDVIDGNAKTIKHLQGENQKLATRCVDYDREIEILVERILLYRRKVISLQEEILRLKHDECHKRKQKDTVKLPLSVEQILQDMQEWKNTEAKKACEEQL